MKIVQSVAGVFHHFDLARELEARGHLERIYSTFPWRRLRREGLRAAKVRTFPWVHAPQVLLGRYLELPSRWTDRITRAAARSFDAYVARTLPDCDAYVQLSVLGTEAARRARALGAKYVCDRGSSHIRYQWRLMVEEYRRWGAVLAPWDMAVVEGGEAQYELADAITIPSEFARRSFVEMGVKPGKLHRIPYGVRLERFRKTTDPAQDSFDVLFAGGVSLRKGVPYLLEAFQRFRHPRKRLRLAGHLDGAMRKLFARFNMERVEVMGPQPQPKLAELMSASHVMVLPSIEEGLALVLGQAMACGCPLISSVNTGGEDLFSDGVEGFLVPIRSSDAILERLELLAQDSSLRLQMSDAAMERVKTLGGWHAYGKEYTAMLQQLISR